MGNRLGDGSAGAGGSGIHREMTRKLLKRKTEHLRLKATVLAWVVSIHKQE